MLLALRSLYEASGGPIAVSPSSIVSAEAFGSVTVSLSGLPTQTIEPTAISSVEAFGAHLLTSSYLVTPSAIASAEVFGAHVLTSTYLVTATSIATGEAFGSAVVTLSGGGAQTVAPSSIVTGETFGSATVKASYTLTMNGIPSGEAFGTPNIAFALRIQPIGIGSEEAIGVPSLDGQLVLGTDVLNIIAQVMFEALGFVSVDTPTRATLETSTSSTVGLQILATRVATVVVFQEISAEAATYSEGIPMTTVVRGSTVTFKANFTDDAGLPINPAQASVFVSFPNPTGSRTTVELTLTQSGDDWTAQWDSGLSKPGTVSWSAHTKATTPAAAVDGTFEVTANPANPEFLA
jgi:hypothetical protein